MTNRLVPDSGLLCECLHVIRNHFTRKVFGSPQYRGCMEPGCSCTQFKDVGLFNRQYKEMK